MQQAVCSTSAPGTCVRSFILRDTRREPDQPAGWFSEWAGDPHFGDFVSITNVCYDARRDRLYCGICSLIGDTLHAFGCESKAFSSLGFETVADRFDVKIHKSLNQLADGTLIAATAGLHGADHWLEAPGGKIVRYDPRRESIEVLATPVPHEYIQSLIVDEPRQIAYGFTWPAQMFFRCDLATGSSQVLACTSGQPHNPVLDPAGGVWGMWDRGEAMHLFRYHPDDGFEFPRTPLPGQVTERFRQIDAMLVGGDGRLYVAQCTGRLLVVDFDDSQRRLHDLGKPWPTSARMPSLLWRDGAIYACCGDDGDTALIRVDPSTGDSRLIARLTDETGESCWRTHDLACDARGAFYIGETDNPVRSGRLWAVA